MAADVQWQYDRFDDVTRVFTSPLLLLPRANGSGEVYSQLRLEAPGEVNGPIDLRSLSAPEGPRAALVFTSVVPIGESPALVLLINGDRRARPEFVAEAVPDPESGCFSYCYAASREVLIVLADACTIELRLGRGEYDVSTTGRAAMTSFISKITTAPFGDEAAATLPERDSTIEFVRARAREAKLAQQVAEPPLPWHRLPSPKGTRRYATIPGRPQAFEWHSEVVISECETVISYCCGDELITRDEFRRRMRVSEAQRLAEQGLAEVQGRNPPGKRALAGARHSSRIERLESSIGPLPLDAFVRLRDKGEF